MSLSADAFPYAIFQNEMKDLTLGSMNCIHPKFPTFAGIIYKHIIIIIVNENNSDIRLSVCLFIHRLSDQYLMLSVNEYSFCGEGFVVMDSSKKRTVVFSS